MKTLKQPFVLFFVAGMVPTPEELQAATQLRARVGYRNASVVNDTDVAEPCDGVAGKVPTPYKKFPTAEAAIANYDKRIAEATKIANATVGTPPAATPPGPAASVPKGFENLPGGDGSLGAPNADKADTASQPATPDATAKPPAWGSGPAKK